MSRVTYKDIADLASVSPATVCRVIHHHPNVKSETRERVLRALRHSGYGIASKDLIGLIIPDASIPYFTNLGFVFQEQLDKLGAHVIMASSEGRADRELALVNQFKGLGLKGLVYITGGEPNDTVLQALADENVPVIVFDRRVQAGNLDFVAVDSCEGMLRAVDYLVTLGHERIGHLKGQPATRTAKDRYEAFHDAMGRNRLEVDKRWVWEGDYRFASGRACAEMLLHGGRALPTAIVAANDAMAIGLMQRLQQEGWVLPRDLSIVGFDNIEISAWVYPSLTTVEQPVRELAYHAIGALMKRIRHHELHPHEPLEPTLRTIEPMLIPRGSTAPPRRRDPMIESADARVVALRRPSAD
jgi:LacI family transcriptional regulator